MYEKPRPYTREDRMYGVNMYDRTWQVRYSWPCEDLLRAKAFGEGDSLVL